MDWNERIDRKADLRSRGLCLSPLSYASGVGSVGLDGRAPCPLCGRRIKVRRETGTFANHKPVDPRATRPTKE